MDTTEVIFGATYMGVNVKYTRTLTNWYGIDTNGYTPAMWAAGDTYASWATGATTANSANANSKGSGYLEANYTYTFAGDVAWHCMPVTRRSTTSRCLAIPTTRSVSASGWWFHFGRTYTTTNATDNSLYHVKSASGDDKKLAAASSHCPYRVRSNT